jgi:uncharacterized membrane protein YfcA
MFFYNISVKGNIVWKIVLSLAVLCCIGMAIGFYTLRDEVTIHGLEYAFSLGVLIPIAVTLFSWTRKQFQVEK